MSFCLWFLGVFNLNATYMEWPQERISLILCKTVCWTCSCISSILWPDIANSMFQLFISFWKKHWYLNLMFQIRFPHFFVRIWRFVFWIQSRKSAAWSIQTSGGVRTLLDHVCVVPRKSVWLFVRATVPWQIDFCNNFLVLINWTDFSKMKTTVLLRE